MTFPNVFVNEGSSGSHPITLAPTAVTAFVGSATRGPVERPVSVRSPAEFERTFGVPTTACPMSVAVAQFFANGGRDAWIVRVVNGAAAATGTADTLSLIAATPGAWGNALRVRVDASALPQASVDGLFTLTVRDTVTGTTERFTDLSVQPSHARFVATVLAAESTLVRLRGAAPSTAPAPTPAAGAGLDALAVTPGSIAFAPDGLDGAPITDAQVSSPALQAVRGGLWALDAVDAFNLLCVPPFTADTAGDIGAPTRLAADAYCRRRGAMFLADPLSAWTSSEAVLSSSTGIDSSAWGLPRSEHTAVYVPWIVAADPSSGGQVRAFAPCGAVAGLIARTDAQQGVWKAPAGREATLSGVTGLSVPMADRDSAMLNPQGVNVLRTFPGVGPVVWGARTLAGADALASPWKYVPVRRFTLCLEESLRRGLSWVAFEPNAAPLWAAVRLSIGSFLHGLFTQGALKGRTPAEAFFVSCDQGTTSAADIAAGVVRIIVGVATQRPADFQLLTITHATAQPTS